MKSTILGIGAYVSENVRPIEELAKINPSWDIEKLRQATGVSRRRIAPEGWASSDIAVAAAEDLCRRHCCNRQEIDTLIVVNQIPDHLLPATSCIVHERLKLSNECRAFDITHGCSGFVYGLWLSNALVASGSASRVLLITADILSRYGNPRDRSVAALFGDGGGAVLVGTAEDGTDAGIMDFKLHTDGSGAQSLIIPAGGGRNPVSEDSHFSDIVDEEGNHRTERDVWMDGLSIFRFAMSVVPKGVKAILQKNNLSIEDIDHFFFHQANSRIVEYIAARLKLPSEKVPMYLEDVGNTSQSTLPLLMLHSLGNGSLKPGDLCLLAGFGVGFSWGFAILRWGELTV